MMMLSTDEFDGVMRKNLPCLINSTLNFTHVKCAHDEENHMYLIEGLPHGWDISNMVVYKFIYHLHRVTIDVFDYVCIDQIADDKYNPVIKWDEELEKYDLCDRESDIHYAIIHALAFAMNDREMVAHNSRNHQNPKEEKIMPKIKAPTTKPKQKKKVYPNLFDKPNGASIKDIQCFSKNGTSYLTVIWTDKDEKGHNIRTTVSTSDGEFNTEIGIAMAIARRYFGGRNEFLRVVDKTKELNVKRHYARRHHDELKKSKKEGSKS